MIHAPNVPNAAVRREQLRDAARSLEAMVLRTLVTSSGAFKGGEGPGAAIRADMFATTLADALARGGGVGLAAQIERQLAGAPLASPASAPGHGAPRSPLLAPTAARASTGIDRADIGPRGRAAAAAPSPLPLAGVVSSPFGLRSDPFTGDVRQHDGVDIAAPHGTEIRAARSGRVVFAGPKGGYGNTVEVDHGDGVATLYAHASDLLVRVGDEVRAGDAIARVGSTGRSTGPHLHFELREDGRPQDPARALNAYRHRAEETSGAGSLSRTVRP